MKKNYSDIPVFFHITGMEDRLLSIGCDEKVTEMTANCAKQMSLKIARYANCSV